MIGENWKTIYTSDVIENPICVIRKHKKARVQVLDGLAVRKALLMAILNRGASHDGSSLFGIPRPASEYSASKTRTQTLSLSPKQCHLRKVIWIFCRSNQITDVHCFSFRQAYAKIYIVSVHFAFNLDRLSVYFKNIKRTEFKSL
jgi:hypothetical protein